MSVLTKKREKRMYTWLLCKDRLRFFMRMDPEAVVTVSSVALLFWGLVAFAGDWSGLQTYIVMERLAAQQHWGMGALVIAFSQMAAVATFHRDSQVITAALASVFWFTLFGLTSVAMFSAPAPWVYIALGLANSWAVALVSTAR